MDREEVKDLNQTLTEKRAALEQIRATKPAGPEQLIELLKNVNATVTSLTEKVKSLNKPE